MVRPERRVLLASASLARVSAEAPGSRPQPKAEMPPVRAGRQKPLKETGARERGATPSERRKPRHSISRKVFERAEPVMSRRRQQTTAANGTAAGPFRGIGGGTFPEKSAEQEIPYPAAWSGKERWYKAGWPKASGAGRESEGSKVPGKACKKTRWREGALLGSAGMEVSARACRKRPKSP
jgi:hypothetical protein